MMRSSVARDSRLGAIRARRAATVAQAPRRHRRRRGEVAMPPPPRARSSRFDGVPARQASRVAGNHAGVGERRGTGEAAHRGHQRVRVAASAHRGSPRCRCRARASARSATSRGSGLPGEARPAVHAIRASATRELDHLAGHVELRLLRRRVADAHRTCAAIAGELIALRLLRWSAAVDAHQRHGSALGDDAADERAELRAPRRRGRGAASPSRRATSRAATHIGSPRFGTTPATAGARSSAPRRCRRDCCGARAARRRSCRGGRQRETSSAPIAAGNSPSPRRERCVDGSRSRVGLRRAECHRELFAGRDAHHALRAIRVRRSRPPPRESRRGPRFDLERFAGDGGRRASAVPYRRAKFDTDVDVAALGTQPAHQRAAGRRDPARPRRSAARRRRSRRFRAPASERDIGARRRARRVAPDGWRIRRRAPRQGSRRAAASKSTHGQQSHATLPSGSMSAAVRESARSACSPMGCCTRRAYRAYPNTQSSFAVLRATASVLPLAFETLPTAFMVVLVGFETAGMTIVILPDA